MTVRDIAKLCEVSPATVSRAISGQAPVSTDVRKRIEHVMAENGYRPKRVIRTSRKRGSNMIGILVPALNHGFFQCVMEEINKQLIDYGKTVLIIPVNETNETQCIQQLRSVPLEGIILLHEEISGNVLNLLETINLSMVMCGALSVSKSFSAVHIDDLSAAYDGTNYLIQLGHRNIGLISDYPHSISSGFQRIAGSKKAMEDKGIPFRDDMVVCEGCDYAKGYSGAKKLLENNPKTTAIFAFSDEAALGVIAGLADSGRRVPEDISVLGFDDIVVSTRCRPELTSVHQPIQDIVAKTLEILIRNIDKEDKMITSITLPHEIVERSSCRKLYTGENL